MASLKTTTTTTVPVPPKATEPVVKAPVKVHRTWRRVSISVFGLIILVIDWRWAVAHLYTLPEHSIAAFSSLTQALFYTVSVIVVFLVTGLTFFSWTASSSIATTIAQQLTGTTTKAETKSKNANDSDD